MLTRECFQDRQKSRKSALENARSVNNYPSSRKTPGATEGLGETEGVNNPSTLTLVDRARMKRPGTRFNFVGFGFRGISEEELTEWGVERPDSGYNSGSEIEVPGSATNTPGVARKGLVSMRGHSNASPKTFSFLPTLSQHELHPLLKRTPMWQDAPAAPVDLHWSVVHDHLGDPIIKRDGQVLESWYWRVVRCPYCGGQHWHQGFDSFAPDEMISDRSCDPLKFVGGRKMHCDRNDQVWWALPEYRLVPIQFRTRKILDIATEQADLDRYFPLFLDGGEAQTTHGSIPVRVFRIERGLVHIKEVHPVKMPRARRADGLGSSRIQIPRELRSTVWHKSNGTCWYCGCDLDPFLNFNVDHVHPVVRGGTNALDNLVPACKSCNATKAAKTLNEFRADRNGQYFWFEEEGLEP